MHKKYPIHSPQKKLYRNPQKCKLHYIHLSKYFLTMLTNPLFFLAFFYLNSINESGNVRGYGTFMKNKRLKKKMPNEMRLTIIFGA